MTIDPSTVSLDEFQQQRDREALKNLGTIKATELVAKTFMPIKWVVQPYLPEGLAILAGRPKIGKSWLALGIAIAVAQGGIALGSVRVQAGDVLALCLEDNERRLQRRLKALLQGSPCPDRLDLVTQWRRLHEGGLDDLRLWRDHHQEARLIVIDTLAKVRTPRGRDRDLYESDYERMIGLKALADEYGVAILVSHHLRKATADDPVDEVSGSTGLTGAVDTVLILKRDRAQADAVLFATGRDIDETETALHFDKATGLWTALGNAEDYRRSQERNEIIKLLAANDPMTPKDVAEALGKNNSTVRALLRKMVMAGEIQHASDGRYTVEDFL